MSQLQQFSYGSNRIEFYIERRSRKTLEISVYPDMSVKVIAPINALLEAILERVKKRAAWILKQIRFFEQFHPKRPERCYLSGESHLYLGREYRLKVMPSIQKQVKLSRGQLLVESHSPDRPDITRYILEKWYFDCAKAKLLERLECCLAIFPDKDFFKPRGVIVRQLSNRWGSMTKKGNLVLNRQLIKAPLECIDYVIIHELCHLHYRDHNRDFYDFLEKTMPDWQKHKMKLEKVTS